MTMKAFKGFLFIVLLALFLFAPIMNVSALISNASEFSSAATKLKELRKESEQAHSGAVSAKEEYLEYRTSELNPNDPVAITKVLKGLEGVTVSSVKALSLSPTTNVIGTYDENSNQWCEGLEVVLTTNTLEDTLLRIEKMQLTLISTTVKAPNTIILQVNVKGV